MQVPAELGSLTPALLDALGYANIGVLILVDRGRSEDRVFERLYTNEAAAKVLGYSLDEMLGLPPLDLLIPEQRQLVWQLSASFRAGQPVPPALELTALHRDGSTVPLELAISPVATDDGLTYVMIMRDVGNQSQLSLLEADRIGLVGALSAGFAHEINNPLTSVLLNLRSLRRRLVEHMPVQVQAQALRVVDDITTGAERIASNVRALQTLATRSETQPIDLAAVVSASLRLAAPTLDSRAHVIRQILPVRPVMGEESRIGQAVLAMMLFSCSGFDGSSTNTSNRIVVSVEERDGAVVVEVSDNGRELPEEEARHAFDPFFRSKTRGAGVGVGLGVARSVAARLGGDVSLAPRPSGGAVITMSLPAAP